MGPSAIGQREIDGRSPVRHLFSYGVQYICIGGFVRCSASKRNDCVKKEIGMTAPSNSQKDEMFRLDPSADVNGTSLLTWFECPPVCLLELFGKPAEGDGHKVSGEYVFTNDKGDVFTVYD